jgi:DNA-binding GntR family transcriptional regulator
MEIEQRILEGFFFPGEKLNERDLASEFGVSRTPIRDVLTSLEAEGLVEHFARRGVYVRKTSLAYVLSLLELLAVLESSCARLAARSGHADDKKLLASKAQLTVDAAEVGTKEYTSSNKEFHETIYRMATNEELVNMVHRVRRKVSPYRKHIHRVAGMTGVSAIEHVEIARAIADRDEKLASDLMFHHLDMQRREFIPFVSILSKTLDT